MVVTKGTWRISNWVPFDDNSGAFQSKSLISERMLKYLLTVTAPYALPRLLVFLLSRAYVVKNADILRMDTKR